MELTPVGAIQQSIVRARIDELLLLPKETRIDRVLADFHNGDLLGVRVRRIHQHIDRVRHHS